MSDITAHPTSRIHEIAVLERRIFNLPIKKFPIKPTNALGSYLEFSIEMVNADEAIELLKQFILDPELIGLTRLPEKLWQHIEGKFATLPTKKFKIDPLHSFNSSATLFVEEPYIELSDLIKLIHEVENTWDAIDTAIARFLCRSIQLKEKQLSDAPKIAKLPTANLPELTGKKQEVSLGHPIRDRAIAEFQNRDRFAEFSSTLIPQIAIVAHSMTSASWWIKNEHRISRAILLQISNTLDDALFQQFSQPQAN